MPTYRKKPVEIEAMQWDGTRERATAIIDWALPHDGTIRWHEDIDNDPTHLAVDTLEGVMRGSKGDYIIKGVQGEFYPCKESIFLATYDEVTN